MNIHREATVPVGRFASGQLRIGRLGSVPLGLLGAFLGLVMSLDTLGAATQVAGYFLRRFRF